MRTNDPAQTFHLPIAAFFLLPFFFFSSFLLFSSFSSFFSSSSSSPNKGERWAFFYVFSNISKNGARLLKCVRWGGEDSNPGPRVQSLLRKPVGPAAAFEGRKHLGSNSWAGDFGLACALVPQRNAPEKIHIFFHIDFRAP